MKCLDRKELEQFLMGKLPPEQLLAIDEHVCGCAECRAVLESLPAMRAAGADLGAALLDVLDCPDYEELSSYVDHALDREQARAVEAHANACQLCSRDIARMQEMRSHAAMREKVVVRPGMSRLPAQGVARYWKRALAGLSIAGAVAAVALSLAQFGSTPSKPGPAAEAPRTAAGHRNTVVKAPSIKPEAEAKKNAVTPEATAPEVTPEPVRPKPAPVYIALLKDGNYRVIRKDGELVLAKRDGSSAQTALEADIEASIARKMATGKVKPAKPVLMALADINQTSAIDTRSSEVGLPSPAPQPVAPAGKIMLSAAPVFTWSKVDLAESYRFRLYDKSGHLLVDETTTGNTFKLSSPLERGKIYSWRVGVRFSESDSWSNSGAARFQVVSDETVRSIENVKRRMPGSHLALGAAYEHYGLYDEADGEYRALRGENPHSDLVHRLQVDTTQAGQ